MAAFVGGGAFCFQVPANRILFVYDLYVAETKGLTRRVQQPKKHPATPAITGDLPCGSASTMLRCTPSESSKQREYYRPMRGQ